MAFNMLDLIDRMIKDEIVEQPISIGKFITMSEYVVAIVSSNPKTIKSFMKDIDCNESTSIFEYDNCRIFRSVHCPIPVILLTDETNDQYIQINIVDLMDETDNAIMDLARVAFLEYNKLVVDGLENLVSEDGSSDSE